MNIYDLFLGFRRTHNNIRYLYQYIRVNAEKLEKTLNEHGQNGWKIVQPMNIKHYDSDMSSHTIYEIVMVKKIYMEP